ncbi:methyltransferase domain-containing protein [Phanerochaete sordida]|uniref:Methyltransferase domain-containing protein n=1 Tax=Phanerochaete sordida TaxID=48140 RepID=A0A9P3LDS5_9APHY|nr:methyltransferase domain-containing protein [Phanerochaete sordida]
MDGQESRFLDELQAFLHQPAIELLFSLHPNTTVTPDFIPPEAWSSWWEWAGEPTSDTESKWQQLWRYYAPDAAPDEGDFAAIPAPLRAYLRRARELQLSRSQGTEASVPGLERRDHYAPTSKAFPRNANLHGMSPKKTHEVQYMSKYAANMLSDLAAHGTVIRHAVDVGAGQAYLSRALRDDCNLRVLAVDWSSVQEEGAARREKDAERAKGKGKKTQRQADQHDAVPPDDTAAARLAYRKIVITADSLVTVTDEWVANQHDLTGASGDSSDGTPVALVALHACGSLTLDVLRAFVRQLRFAQTGQAPWRPAAGLIVGCCYNLLRPEDCTSLTGRKVNFAESHLQLAAQMPLQWCRTDAALADASLAARKIAWRALLSGIMSRSTEEQPLLSGRTRELRRLGRLSDSAYRDWEGFLAIAQEKLDAKVVGVARDRVMESRLEVFHFLRCVLGPVVESFILLDRKQWLQEQLAGLGNAWEVRLVNLFDQGSGSARNVGIVVVPRSSR